MVILYVYVSDELPSMCCINCRFRVCQLVARMMNYAADAATIIGPSRLDRVQEVMMHRLYDKVSRLIA